MDQLVTVFVIGLLLGGIYGLVSIGLNLIFGVVRIVNFAQGELVMLGMYGTYFAYSGWELDPYLAILVVSPALFLIGVAIQRLVMQPLQTEPMMQIFASFGLLILMQNIVLATTRGEALSVRTSYSGTVLEAGDIKIGLSRLLVFVAATVITILMAVFLKRTMAGKSIRAVIQDRQSARLMGINVERTYILTFGGGAALAGLAGAMLTPIYTLTPTIGVNLIFPAFAVVILGGLGSVPGAFFGGLIVGLVEAFAGHYVDPALKQGIWFTVFIVMLIVRPAGLFGRVGAEEVGFREQA